MGTISSKPIRKTSWLDELIKLDRFLKFDEGDIIYGATTGLSLIRGMNENSFDLSFSIRFNVPEKQVLLLKRQSKPPCREISEFAPRFFTQSNRVVNCLFKHLYSHYYAYYPDPGSNNMAMLTMSYLTFFLPLRSQLLKSGH